MRIRGCDNNWHFTGYAADLETGGLIQFSLVDMSTVGAPVSTYSYGYGLVLNPLTGGLYLGFYADDPDVKVMQMFTTSGNAATVPTDVGTFSYGAGYDIYGAGVRAGPPSLAS